MSLSLRKIRPALRSLGAPATTGRTSFLFFQNARQQQTYGSLHILASAMVASRRIRGLASCDAPICPRTRFVLGEDKGRILLPSLPFPAAAPRRVVAAGLLFVPLPLRFALIETSSLSDAAGEPRMSAGCLSLASSGGQLRYRTIPARPESQAVKRLERKQILRPLMQG